MNRRGIAGGAIALLAIPCYLGWINRSSVRPAMTSAVKPASHPASTFYDSHRMTLSDEDLRRAKRQDDLCKEAEALVRKKQWVKAEKKFRQAGELFPGEYPLPVISLGLAQCLENQRKFHEALATMRPGLFSEDSSIGNYSDAIVHYAELAEKLGNSKEASMAFSEAAKSHSSNDSFIENTPNNPTARQTRALAYVCAGMDLSCMENGNEKSKESFRKSLRIDPDCVLAHYYLAMSLKRGDEARNHYYFVATYGSVNLKRIAERCFSEYPTPKIVPASQEEQPASELLSRF